MHDVLAHLFQHGLGLGEGLLAATHHEGERARRGAADTARNRRIDHVQPGLLRQGTDVPRAFDVDGRAVDQQRPLADIGQHVLLVDRAHMLAGRQHGDDDFRVLHGLGSRCGLPGTLVDRRGDGRRR